ncbi:MAG: molybdopterin-dependent oxidoreductase, partial [Proteobacteria bacterium]|nr:molybdopterin-dependent oxidoreductase [Pseudomonadota bacterium]
ASDAGLIPMMLPDYQPVADPAVRTRFAQLWGKELPTTPGLTVTEILDAAARREVQGMYILGENPAMSDPDLTHARAALAGLAHLVVQDIFLTETAALADVILPASSFAEKTGSFTNTDRTVQLGRAAITPPGEARQDLWIVAQLAGRLGLDGHSDDPAKVFEEMRRQLEHWHTGSMTRRSSVLDALEPTPYINLHPVDLAALKVSAGGTVKLCTRRGELVAAARIDAGLPQRTVFMPFCYVEAAANLLTNPAIDPFT